MAPKIAFVLCSVFVLGLLKIERKQSFEVSNSMWLPTIWMLLISSKPMSMWFSGGLRDSIRDIESGSTLDQIVFSGIFAIGLIILINRKFSISTAIRENFCLILLISYGFVSILWSDVPLISFKRWIKEIIAVIMGLLVLSEKNPYESVKSIIRRTIYILIPFSVVLIKYFPDYGVQYGIWTGTRMWIGVTLQKNGLGRLCMISLFFIVWTLIRRVQGQEISVGRYQTYAEFILLITVLWLFKGPAYVNSATALGAFIGGIGLFSSLLLIKKIQKNFPKKIVIILFFLTIGIGISAPFTGGLVIQDFSEYFNRDESLTGRTGIWNGLVPDALKRPILGYGFGGFWNNKTIEEHWDSEAHSGYLDVFLGLGIVGLGLTGIFLLSSCCKSFRELSNNFDFGNLSICFLFICLLHNITESSLQTFTNQVTATVLFLSMVLGKKQEDSRN